MAFTISKLGLLSLLASAVLAVPTHHNRHKHAKRVIVWETDIVTAVNVVTDVVYATAAAQATPSPVAAAAVVAAAAPAPAAQPLEASSKVVAAPAAKANILNWDNFERQRANTVAATSVAAVIPSVAPISPSPTSVKAAATSAAAPVTTSASASSGSKRGVSYNLVALANIFSGSTFSWAYNWGSSSDGTLLSNLEYVPMLWGSSSTFTSGWASAVTTALSSGSTYLLGFNEPDLPAQSNMSPAAAAAAWLQYMQPYSSKAKLVSPAVTNGAAPMGLGWMSDFMSACTGCTFDAVAIHWYDSASNAEYFKQHVTDAHTQTGKPIWVTEFGATGSDAEISAFLSEVLPWLDSQDFVERYAYFMAQDGALISGTGLSSYGETYVNAQ